jgi:tetratricopeptide (TPR) repeat protein
MRLIFVFYFLFGAIGCLAAEDLAADIQLYQSGKFKPAADSLAQKVESAPQDAELHLWLGKAYYKLRRWDDAVREFEKAVQLNPNKSVYHLWLGRACGQKASQVSFFSAYGWARRVVKEFQTAERLAPDNVDVRFDLLEYYLTAPGIVGGGRDKAEAEVRAIAEIRPNLGFLARAQILQKDKKLDQARTELEKAIQAYPVQAERYQDLAEFLLQQQDFSHARSFAVKALASSPMLPRSRLLYSAVLVRIGESLDEAEGILKQLSAGPLQDDDPTFEEVYYWLGEAFLKQGKKEAAIQAFTSALIFNPEFDMAKDAMHQAQRGL